jgi:transposase
VFSAIMRQVIRMYALDVSHVHYDTTSKSFSGTYAEQTAEPGPQIVRGYSKDHRPDLAQLLFGVVMSRDGVLVAGEVASGNEQDMTANGYWITHIRQHLGLEVQQFLLYVADSAAVTEENLRLCRLFHLDLLSRLPERFELAETLYT